MPNWGDTVTIAGQPYTMTPEAGALALHISTDTWRILEGPETPAWAAAVGHHYRPILPGVPKGCTRELVLGLIEVERSNDALAEVYRIPGWYCLVDLLDVLGGRYECSIHKLFLRNTAIPTRDLPALKLAIQRYEALLAWWAANEVKHG